jgi:Arc-like DNA binding domain
MARKLTDTVHLRLRFDESLRRRLERAAESNKRSMNAEIIHRLEESFHRVDQEELIKSVAKQTATATVDRMRVVRPGHSETQNKPTQPAASNQKDNA